MCSSTVHYSTYNVLLHAFLYEIQDCNLVKNLVKKFLTSTSAIYRFEIEGTMFEGENNQVEEV